MKVINHQFELGGTSTFLHNLKIQRFYFPKFLMLLNNLSQINLALCLMK